MAFSGVRVISFCTSSSLYGTYRCPPSARSNRPHASESPTGSRAPTPTATPPDARPERRKQHVAALNGQSCSRAHRNTSRCPLSAALRQRLRVPRAVVLPRPLQHRQVSAPSGGFTRYLVPRTLLVQSCSRAQHSTCNCPPRSTHPMAAVCPRPLQHGPRRSGWVRSGPSSALGASSAS